MNILFIGSSGPLSLIPFKRLLSAGHNVAAVGIYKPLIFDAKIIALENESLALAARQATIPVIDLSLAIDEILKQLSIFSIDVIIMSCYGKRLPEELIRFAAKGCFNMHPSLLPAFRGSEPIFWQMKQGADMGVSWHCVSRDFDAGDVVMQQKVFIDDAASFSDISLQLAISGAALLEKLLADVDNGKLMPVAQPDETASYQHYPVASDFSIDPQQSAQQLFNFMCATQSFGYLYHYRYAQHSFMIKAASDYDNNAGLDAPEVQGNRLYIPCNEGVLIVTYTDKIQH